MRASLAVADGVPGYRSRGAQLLQAVTERCRVRGAEPIVAQDAEVMQLFPSVVVVRVSTVADFAFESITGPARGSADRARVVLAVDDAGEIRTLKNNLPGRVEVIG